MFLRDGKEEVEIFWGSDEVYTTYEKLAYASMQMYKYYIEYLCVCYMHIYIYYIYTVLIYIIYIHASFWFYHSYILLHIHILMDIGFTILYQSWQGGHD